MKMNVFLKVSLLSTAFTSLFMLGMDPSTTEVYPFVGGDPLRTPTTYKTQLGGVLLNFVKSGRAKEDVVTEKAIKGFLGRSFKQEDLDEMKRSLSRFVLKAVRRNYLSSKIDKKNSELKEPQKTYNKVLGEYQKNTDSVNIETEFYVARLRVNNLIKSIEGMRHERATRVDGSILKFAKIIEDISKRYGKKERAWHKLFPE